MGAGAFDMYVEMVNYAEHAEVLHDLHVLHG